MSKNKTSQTEESVYAFTENVENEVRRNDALKLVEIFKSVSGYEPKMFGPSIIGFGSYHYKYESGHEGDAPLAGLASRSNAITLYLASDFNDRKELLEKLGRHKTGKGCLYLQKPEDIDTEVLGKMIAISIEYIKQKYPE